MLVNDIRVLSSVITDMNKTRFKDTSDLSSYTYGMMFHNWESIWKKIYLISDGSIVDIIYTCTTNYK